MLPRGLLKKHSNTLSYIARSIDLLCVLLGAILAYYWRFRDFSIPDIYMVAILLAILFSILFFSMSNIYESWRGREWFRQVRIITVSWLSVAVMLIMLAFLTKTGAKFSREWGMVWLVSTWILLLSFRYLLTLLLKVMRSSGLNHKRMVIIGAGELGRKVISGIKNAEWVGLDIIGLFDDNSDLHGKKIEGVKVHGSLDKLGVLSDRGQVDEVWIALPLRAEKRVAEILHELRHSTVTVRFVPDIFGLSLLNHSITAVAGFPVINISQSPMYGINRLSKFIEDKMLASIILTIVFPLMLLIAIGVKLSTPGPVFFRQERVSWNGVPFMMLKFRSMPVDAESNTGAVWAKHGENRATKLGSFLRKTSLDELPQFLNVLKGDMSIVGPRPERPIFVHQFKNEIPYYMKKHMVKAGITGWAQINGWRGDTDLKKRIEYDLYYIDHWSLWFDLKIIFLTLFKGFVDKNAY